jgi:hypothetical protein
LTRRSGCFRQNTEDEELEMKLLKKKKLYFKDLMEKIAEEMKQR